MRVRSMSQWARIRSAGSSVTKPLLMRWRGNRRVPVRGEPVAPGVAPGAIDGPSPLGSMDGAVKPRSTMRPIAQSVGAVSSKRCSAVPVPVVLPDCLIAVGDPRLFELLDHGQRVT